MAGEFANSRDLRGKLACPMRSDRDGKDFLRSLRATAMLKKGIARSRRLPVLGVRTDEMQDQNYISVRDSAAH
jgi:hypothetical protein